MPRARAARPSRKPSPSRSSAATVAGVSLTHPDRVVYPETGLTKQGLADYWEQAWPLMEPHVVGRPVALLRCPDGRTGECFYQKHWTSPLPEGLSRVTVREASGRAAPYPVIDDVRGAIGLIQFGAMEVHTWGSRADQIEAPDRIVFDLDPGPGVPWSSVQAAARTIRVLLGSVELDCWIKTTGGKGLHIVVPIERRSTWSEVSRFAEAVATACARQEPSRFVTQASKSVRTGRIFIDWLRNTRGALAIAPWSTRAREGAPVSFPFRWDQLPRIQSGADYTIERVLPLWQARFVDPWADVGRARQRLTQGTTKAIGERR